jgi:hypothetical protein
MCLQDMCDGFFLQSLITFPGGKKSLKSIDAVLAKKGDS